MPFFKFTRRSPSDHSRSASTTPVPSERKSVAEAALPAEIAPTKAVDAATPDKDQTLKPATRTRVSISPEDRLLQAPPAPKPTCKPRFSDAWAIPTTRDSISHSSLGSSRPSGRPSICSVLSRASDLSHSDEHASRRSSVASHYDLRSSERRSSVEQTLSAFSFSAQSNEAIVRKSHRTEPYVASLLSQRRSSAQMTSGTRRERERRATIHPTANGKMFTPIEHTLVDSQPELDAGLRVTVASS